MKKLFLFVTFFSTTAFAGEVAMHVYFGDKISHFKVWTEKGKNYFSTDKVKKAGLSRENFDYFQKKAAGLSNLKSNDLKFCQRHNMVLHYRIKNKPVMKSGCIGSSTEIAKKMAVLANSLEMLE
jgi:hypothetical protein